MTINLYWNMPVLLRVNLLLASVDLLDSHYSLGRTTTAEEKQTKARPRSLTVSLLGSSSNLFDVQVLVKV